MSRWTGPSTEAEKKCRPCQFVRSNRSASNQQSLNLELKNQGQTQSTMPFVPLQPQPGHVGPAEISVSARGVAGVEVLKKSKELKQHKQK